MMAKKWHTLQKAGLFTVALLLSMVAASQATWEINMVRNLNPQYPSNDLVKAVSSTAKPLSAALPAGLFAVSLLQHNKKGKMQALEMAGSLLITTISTEALKKAVNRTRPGLQFSGIYPDKYDDSPSFPSGHTSVAFSTAATLAIQYHKWYITVPAFAWATGVGYSRLYLGQHYPTDVLMGAALGTGSAYLAHWLHKKLFSKTVVSAKQ